jgi:SAM-dependent methyltransferase
MTSSNPWLQIPASDYLDHMSNPAVGQRPVLNRLFAEALSASRPRAVLAAGCSTGNGLEHLDPRVTRRVTCVDLNPAYLQAMTELMKDRPEVDFRLMCGDIATCPLPGSFNLVHAALLLEYVEWERVLPRLAGTLSKTGTLSLVIQRRSEVTPAVTPSPFMSLLALEPIFRFVDSGALIDAASAINLDVAVRRTEPLPSGKAFEVLHFRRAAR